MSDPRPPIHGWRDLWGSRYYEQQVQYRRELRWHQAKAITLLPLIWSVFVPIAGVLWMVHPDRNTATQYTGFIVFVWLCLWTMPLYAVLIAAGLQDYVSHQMDVLKESEARWRGQEPERQPSAWELGHRVWLERQHGIVGRAQEQLRHHDV